MNCTKFLLCVCILLLATLETRPVQGHKKKPVSSPVVKAQQPVDVLLKELEDAHVTLNRVYSLSDQGFNTADIERDLPGVEQGLALINEKMASTLSLAHVNNLQMYDIMLDDISENLESWKARLMSYDKELVRLNAEMKLFTTQNDSVFKQKAIDSNYRGLINDEIRNIKNKWAQTSSLSKADFVRINSLRKRVSASWVLSVDLQDKVVTGMNNFWVEVFHRNYAYLWKGPQNKTGHDLIAPNFIRSQESIISHYLRHYSRACLGLFAFVCLFFGWTTYNFYRLKRLSAGQASTVGQVGYLGPYPVAISILLFLVFLPFLDVNTPALFQGLIQLVVCILLSFLLYKRMPSKTYRYFLFSSAVFAGFFLFSNVFTYHFSIRLVLLLISAVSCVGGLSFHKAIKGTKYSTPFLHWTIWIATAFSALSAILNVFGWVTFAIQLGLAATYGILEAIALRTVIQVINNALLLEAMRKGYAFGSSRPIHNRALRTSLNQYLIFLMIIAWLFTLADNLNVFDYLFTETQDYLNTAWKIGSTEFTPGNLLLFLFILYLSSLLQKFTGYFFDNQSDAGNPDFKRKGSKLAIIRLVLLIVGFLFAIAASGLPLDKITIVLGALGVGIGLGLQNIVHNLVSGIILIFERPFQIGDLVEVGTRKGRVKDIGIRSSKLITTEGSEVIVPNGDLLSERVVNWTYSNNNVRVELLVKLAAGSDIELAKKVIADELDKQRLIYKKIKPEIFLNNFVEGGIELKVLVWILDVHDEMSFRSDFLSILFTSLREKGIQMV